MSGEEGVQRESFSSIFGTFVLKASGPLLYFGYAAAYSASLCACLSVKSFPYVLVST